MQKDIEKDSMTTTELRTYEINIVSFYKIYEEKLRETQKIFFDFKKAKKGKIVRFIGYLDNYKDYTEE